MKIYKNMFTQMTTMEELLIAWDMFKKDKRNREDVQAFEYKLEDNLFDLHSDLVNGQYRHGTYNRFYVRDPKIREIHKASVRDRIVHHLLSRWLVPVFEPTFIHDSYSSRVGKGTHRAVEQISRMLKKVRGRSRTCYVLKCDIRKFFASIDHAILLEIIRQRIKDNDLVCLIENIVESFENGANSRERERESMAHLARRGPDVRLGISPRNFSRTYT
ncbi:MAG: hypothetical protein HZA95_00345 [Candidatus Vogelbacteria bacterium]|nr:hypothetical protein [Candidatus Vogelbacteria bacterium]